VRSPAALVFIIACGGCSGRQSALNVAGTDAARISQLFLVMMIGALIIWAGVIAAAIYAIRVKPGTHTEREAYLFILGGGVALPAVVLCALLWYGLPVLPRVLTLAPGNPLQIHVTGKQWWWQVRYVTAGGVVETANELRLPVGQRLELQLTSADVIHSFWVPPIAGKMDMIPGRVTRIALEPIRTGVFRGTCAEYCGASHALMALDVVVSAAGEFAGWLEQQQRPAEPAADDQGLAAFLANGCSACHTIRGTRAHGVIGPDLTHVGSRRSIAAGALPRTAASFAGWIVETDRLKPGVHMPAFRMLPASELTAMASFLERLR
jgi:cytochrome c oxidase subunit II